MPSLYNGAGTGSEGATQMTKSSWSPDAGSEPRGGATQWSGFHPHRVEQRNGVCDDENQRPVATKALSAQKVSA